MYSDGDEGVVSPRDDGDEEVEEVEQLLEDDPIVSRSASSAAEKQQSKIVAAATSPPVSGAAAAAAAAADGNNNNASGDGNDALLVHNVSAFLHQGDVVQKRSVENRNAVKGVSKFAHSTAFLCQQLAKGPLSDAGIKKLDIGLHVVATSTSTSSPPAPQPTATAADPKSAEAATTQSSQPPTTTTTVTLASSPLREALFKAGESLLAVGQLLEAVEHHSTRLAIAKKRREMLVEMRDKMLKLGAVSSSSFGSAPAAGGAANGGVVPLDHR